MKTTVTVDRRRFVLSVTAVAGGILTTGRTRLRAADAAVRENEHFWFRGQPDGPYIDSQRDSRAFGFGDGKIFLSDDNAKSWAHSAPFPDAENITYSCLLKNGNVLFA